MDMFVLLIDSFSFKVSVGLLKWSDGEVIMLLFFAMMIFLLVALQFN